MATANGVIKTLTGAKAPRSFPVEVTPAHTKKLCVDSEVAAVDEPKDEDGDVAPDGGAHAPVEDVDVAQHDDSMDADGDNEAPSSPSSLAAPAADDVQHDKPLAEDRDWSDPAVWVRGWGG